MRRSVGDTDRGDLGGSGNFASVASAPERVDDDPAPLGRVRISVAIGTYNGARTLGAALDAILCQQHRTSYEVIVVDDGSTDDTPRIADRPGVRLIVLDVNQGHGHALNVALAAARGEILATMDDDCVPPPTWIQEVSDAWETLGSDVSMLGGSVLPLETDTLNRRYVRYRRPLAPQEAYLDERAGLLARLRYALQPPRERPERRSVFFVAGANMSVRVGAVREVGGFPEVWGFGEEEGCSRALRLRFGAETVQFFPDLIMFHNYRPLVHDTLRRARAYGRSAGRDWVSRKGIPSLRPLPVLAVLAAGAVTLFSAPVALLAIVAAPLVLYRNWFAAMRASRDFEPAVYPYLQMVEEFVCNVGFVEGMVRAARD